MGLSLSSSQAANEALDDGIDPMAGHTFVAPQAAVATFKGKLKKKKKKKGSSQPPLAASAGSSTQFEDKGKTEQPTNLQGEARDIQSLPPSYAAAAGPLLPEDGEEGKSRKSLI